MEFRTLLLSCVIVFVSILSVWASPPEMILGVDEGYNVSLLSEPQIASINSSNVELVGRTPGAVFDVYTVGDYAYLSAGATLTILDVSDPSDPTEVGRINTPVSAFGIHVVGGYAYVADHNSGLRVIDISDPTNPQEVGFYDTPGHALGVYKVGKYAYVADGSDGLRVIDVSEPTNLQEVGFYDTPGDAWGVDVIGGYAYVADYHRGLRVIDVSDPTNPQEVGFHDTLGKETWTVYVVGGYAYVADHEAGLRVVDVSDPTNPQEVGFYDTPGYANDVHVVGGYAYVADAGSGMCILRYSIPQAIYDLIDSVEDMNLQAGIEGSLNAKLEAAQDALLAANSESRKDAINKLEAFINAVNAQRGRKLTDEQADLLVDRAQFIISALGGETVVAAPAYTSASLFAQNYPNPFNPDTWIPYQLAQDVDVTIRIYDAAGHLVRILDLGHKPAGFYMTREKAAYWDGRNEAGEPVASGIYFYTIQAGEYTATRKMAVTR